MRRNYTVKHQKSHQRRWLMLAGIILIIAASTLSFLQYKYHLMNVSSVSNYATRLRTWFAEHNVHLNQNIQKVKQFANNQDEAEPPIHFEFYKTLSSTQMTASQSTAVLQPITSTPVGTVKKVVNEIAAKPIKSTTLPTLISASDLEKDLSQEISEDNYVIQAGVFKTATSAEQLKRSLTAIGFSAKVVKFTNADKEIYRVQLGPYNNKSQAKLAQQRLQHKGMQGTIRKI